MSGDGAWSGRILLDHVGGLFLGQGGATPLHAHNAFKLVVPLDGSARVTTRARGPLRGRVLVVRPNEPHTVDARDCRLALVYVEPQSRLGRALWAHESASAGTWAHRDADALLEPLVEAAARSARLPSMEEVLVPLFTGTKPAPLDRRVRRAAERIGRELCAGVPVGDLAASVGLSASRLSHLFAEALGTPIARYRRWQHLRRAMDLLARGMGVTATAHQAGFSDAAHLCRSFVQMMGITPGVFAQMHLEAPSAAATAQRIRSMR